MKNKSSNHKSTNRFKFTSFADRVNAIDVRHTALYHLEHVNAETCPPEDETNFHSAIIKWRVLNLTTEYVNFTKKVGNIITLPQLLHRKDEVVNLLIENLESATVLNLQPLLEIIVVLAKDLQEDFYEYFPKFLKTLISLLNTKETDQLEWTLVCLAFLFKTLRTFLKRDILIVFEAVLPLLSESMPWYINNFAAESFAFVARDIKDKRKFLRVLVKTVSSENNGIVGCGRLLFEVIRGVGNHFHSCTKTFLQFLFEALEDKAINQDVYFQILTQTITDMLQVIQPKNSEDFWVTILNAATNYSNSYKTNEKSNSLEYLLRFIGQALEHNEACFLVNPFPVLVLIVQVLDGEFSESVVKVTSQIGVLILLSKHTNIPHEDAVSVVRKILQIPFPSVVLDFVQEVVNCSTFEIIVLPRFLSSIENFDTSIIKVLSKICITKSPLSKSGIELYSWVKYPIDFGTKCDAYSDIILKALGNDVLDITKSPDECISSLVMLPHIKNLNTSKVQNVLESLFLKLLKSIENFSLMNETNEDHVKILRNLLFTLSVTLEAMVHTVELKSFEEFCSRSKLIDVLKPHLPKPELICSLRLLDLYLTVCHRQKTLDLNILEKLAPVIDKNLTSPFHEVRLLMTHVCSLFEEKIQKLKSHHPEHKDKKENILTEFAKRNKFEVFSLCYSVESLPLSMNDYREQLVNMSKMSHASTQFEFCANTPYECFALKYALGFLHVNFSLLWDPLKQFILTYATGMSPAAFWEVFYPTLYQATSHARIGITIPDCNNDFNGDFQFLNMAFCDYHNIVDNPDYSLYRIHLWQILYEASALTETKNRDVTPIFLDFLKVEFENQDYVNVFVDKSDTADDTTNNQSSTMEQYNIPELEETLDESENKTVKLGQNTLTKTTYDTLIALLKVYSNIQNPKALYMEKVLYNIYLDFLMHKNPTIQKIALDCLMRYKNKHLTPYKEHLYNLIDGKKFKDELRTFKIQADEEGIRADDRNEVIPIILRITFSKMITNIGIDKKGGSQLRRSLVIRFLSGCEEAELIAFTKMAFKIFEPYLDLKLTDIPQLMSKNINDLAVISPKRILGTLQLVDTMREQFTRPGQESLMLHLLKIVFCVGCTLNQLLYQQQSLKAGYSKILREIRGRCILSASRFLEQFEKYQWNFESDILPMYDVFIWPIIERLPTEGVYSPTPLLKMLNIWSQHPQYHVFFNVHKLHSKECTPIVFFLQLLNNSKIHPTVNDMSMQILEKLITLETDEESSLINIPEIYSVPIEDKKIEDLKLLDKLNYGSSILISHVSTIVEILKLKFGHINPKKLQKRDLVIISRITELVYESETVDILLQFSLPILISRVGQNSAEDTLEASIEALANLLLKASEPKKFVRLITPLFSKVIAAAPRKGLCKILEVLSEKDESLQILASIISDMNAPDEKWIEQPDFEKRMRAYKKIYQLVEDSLVDVDLGALIIQNCFFTIRYNNDLSLRNMATACLQKICPRLICQYKKSMERDYLIRDTILLLIRNSLKIDNDILRMEGISLLGELVRECSDTQEVFKELLPLSNKANKEVDFFENLQHLQFHRKIRALQKFCNHVKESQTVPGYKTLTQFIIPVASQFICSEKYTPKYALVDAAIEVIGTVCRFLPWRQYEAMLKFYVKKLQTSTEYQKQLIKLISTILDSFHFDLSRANVDTAESMLIVQTNKTLPDDVNQTSEEKHDELEMVLETDEVGEEAVEVQAEVIPFERVHTLSPSTAKKAICTIKEILTQLDWNSSQLMEHESMHKLVKKSGSSRREAEEKLKLPMALAVIKLLQKLPQPMLNNNILSIFVKVCNFLKSPMIGVRCSAREILSKIMLAIGTSQLGTLLELLSALLTRGIHVHVLISTVHTILITLKDQFKPGDMDTHLDNILKVCLNDLFGKASEEKEVAKIGHKTPEAKPSMKSFSTLRIIGQNISESSISNLVKPFKDTAESSHSKRTILKVQTALQNISLGLGENNNVSIESLLNFLHDILSGSVNRFVSVGKKRKIVNEREERYKILKPDCFLIAPEPKNKKGIVHNAVRTSAQANNHVVTEFALNLFYSVLQKDKISDANYKEPINKCVPFVIDSLKSPQVKVSTVALKCVTALWVKRFDLSFLKNQIDTLAETIFQILHKYATSGLSKKDDNFHLVANAFKAVTALIREVKYYSIKGDQVKALLLYAEHDINDNDRQATAFSLIKTIIGAKYKIDEIHDVMKKVANLSILSENPRTRDEARIVMLTFVLNYPLQKKLLTHIEFYLTQLSYELEHGRISAIKMLQAFIEKFTEDLLCRHGSLIYISMGTQMINDSSPDCKALIAECLENLLKRIPLSKRHELFKINIALLKSSKVGSEEMGAQLCVRFVNVEKHAFKSRLETLLPELANLLYEENWNVGKLVRIKEPETDFNKTKKDNVYIKVLLLLDKICEVCPMLFVNEKYQNWIDEINVNCQSLLGHSHSWVRLNAAKFLVSYFESVDLKKLSKVLNGITESEQTAFQSVSSLKSVTMDLSSQLIPGSVSSEMADVVCKNLMLLLKIAIILSEKSNMSQEEIEEKETFSVFWILRILKSSINSEVTKSPGITVIRMSIFKMMDDLIPNLKNETVLNIAKLLLPCIVRETAKTDTSVDGIKHIADKVEANIRQSLGDISFNELLSRVQAKLNTKRKERKQKIAQEKINNPEKAAKRKLVLKEKKKNFKRKKVDFLKGKMPKNGHMD